MKINQNGQSNEWCGTHIRFDEDTECGLCHGKCENKWGNNGYPLTEKRICNVCNDKVIRARISVGLDLTFDPHCGEDSPDEPDFDDE